MTEQRDADSAVSSRSEVMGGLAKGLRIIEAFDATHAELTVSTAAKAAGVTPAAARRCLLTLAELGYVSYDGKYFRPAPRMQRLGGTYGGSASLPVLAQPHLQAVRDRLGESASLAVLDGAYVTFVARAESQRIVTMNVRLGARLPAHASATGRLLLAALPDDELDRRLADVVPERTGPNTLTDLAQIGERIRATRSTGVSFTDEELEVGVRTVAVPVIDVAGRTHAALSLAVLASRTPLAELLEHHVPVMRRAADQLGQML